MIIITKNVNGIGISDFDVPRKVTAISTNGKARLMRATDVGGDWSVGASSYIFFR